VEMTPQDVQQATFDSVRRGFDAKQVGTFLDQVAAAVARRDRELHEARTEIDALQRTVVDARQNEEAFRLTMNAATDAKEEMLRRATEAAEKIEGEARASADLYAERSRAGAEDEVATARRGVEALQQEKEMLESELENLRSSLESVQAALEGVGLAEAITPQRAPLELVVHTDDPPPQVADEALAARVGDLRG